uniref:Sugar ABC transporter substrate-binding protein n=1 Tax=Hirondellea gigas TaxID=1518452 RepID=A0A6A7G6T0_9CRUS
MKKILVLVLSLILLVTVTTKEAMAFWDEKNKKEKITVWLPPMGENDEAIWKPIIKEFEDKNDVKVDLEIIPWSNYSEKYALGVASGQGPDVGYMYAEMFPQFIQMGAVEDLTSYLTKKDYENYLYIDDGKMMGGLYGLAIEAANPAVIYYNKDILKSIGEKVPITWNDFIRCAVKATKDTNNDGKIDQWGYSQGWGAPYFGDLNWNWYGFLWQAGGDIFNKDLKTVKFNDKAGIKTANFLKDLKFKYNVLPPYAMAQTNKEMLQTTFGPGKSLFSIYLSSAATEILDRSFKDLNYGMILSLKDVDMGTFASVDQLVLMSAAKDKKLAFDLIQFMLSPESMTKFHKHHPRAPISKGESYQGDINMKDIIETKKGIYRPLVVGPHGIEIYEYLWKQLQMMMIGEKTPEEALNNAAEYSNKLLDKK